MYSFILGEEHISKPVLKPLGVVLVAVGAVGGLVAGNLFGFGILGLETFSSNIQNTSWIISPFILCLLAGVAII